MANPIPQPTSFKWEEHPAGDHKLDHHWRAHPIGAHDSFDHADVRAHPDGFRAELGSFITIGDATGFDKSKACAEAAFRALVALNNTLSAPGPDLSKLSERERQVLAHLELGKRPPEIAKALFIAVHTVRGHLKSCYRKTGARSQVALLALVRGKVAA